MYFFTHEDRTGNHFDIVLVKRNHDGHEYWDCVIAMNHAGRAWIVSGQTKWDAMQLASAAEQLTKGTTTLRRALKFDELGIEVDCPKQKR